MRKIVKDIIIQGFGSIAIGILFYIVVKSLFLAVIIILVLLFIVMIKPAFIILNKLTKRTSWYNKKIGDTIKFRKTIRRNLDICNLGSTSGKYAFDYNNTGLKGENWALSPQTLSYDFRILKNYFSYLKDGATVLMPLCPLSFCKKDYEDDLYNTKYYSFLHPVLIQNYSKKTKQKVMRFVNTPFHFSPIKSIVRIIKDIPATGNLTINNVEKDVEKLINSWKKEFCISDLEAPVSDINLKCIIYNTNLLSEMISFCLERNLKPVIIIPPVTKMLGSNLTKKFRENYIYSILKKVNTDQIVFLNYLDDERFADLNLYFNSYFLNKKGQKLFTNIVLRDLKLI